MKNDQVHTSRTMLVSDKAPFQFVEAYKSLRTNLQFASVNKKLQKIIVTSSIPGEGKTTVAINLAITLAESGSKVILVDADLRKPAIHRYLHLDAAEKSTGITTALAGIQDIEKCIFQFSDLGIYVITSGPIPPNPAELIGSKAMGKLINTLAESYDYIILDTPPVSVVTDAALLSKYADGVVFVLRQNFTTIETAKAAKQSLENVDANIVGCVFNAFDATNSNKSYEYYRYKYYGDYSSK